MGREEEESYLGPMRLVFGIVEATGVAEGRAVVTILSPEGCASGVAIAADLRHVEHGVSAAQGCWHLPRG